jgi:hypothetical protein
VAGTFALPAERFVRSLRQECLDHFVIFTEKQLWNVLKSYVDYYNNYRSRPLLEIFCNINIYRGPRRVTVVISCAMPARAHFWALIRAYVAFRTPRRAIRLPAAKSGKSRWFSAYTTTITGKRRRLEFRTCSNSPSSENREGMSALPETRLFSGQIQQFFTGLLSIFTNFQAISACQNDVCLIF